MTPELALPLQTITSTGRSSDATYLTSTLLQGENASQAAEIVNGVYGADTVTANYLQFRFRRFRSGIFDVKVAPRPSSKMSIKSLK
ncbi:hypothetical protein TNCV_1494001 [Trichonephila clavipes]|nr:hypothetical protein TNCV_1494001 [Trichonephila clavipes]